MDIVLNADDFGMSADTVDETIAAFDAGLLTSATIMVGAPETAAALAFARAHPQFSFGVHLVFVGDGDERPLTSAHDVPDLVDARGRLLPTNTMRTRALLRRVSVEQIALEAAAQIEFVRRHGVDVSHVDSHRHLHKFAPFRSALRAVLPGFGIGRVRNVQDVYLRRPLKSPTFWAGPIWRRGLARDFTTTRHFYMPTSAADEDWSRLSERLPSGTSLEVGLHPGRLEPWRRAELASLAPFAQAAVMGGHRLVSWREIGTR